MTYQASLLLSLNWLYRLESRCVLASKMFGVVSGGSDAVGFKSVSISSGREMNLDFERPPGAGCAGVLEFRCAVACAARCANSI